jgi:DNA-binding response OmpR family regulator
MNQGADAYVTKPFEVSELIDTIRRLLERQAADRKYNVEKVKGFIEGRTKELVDAIGGQGKRKGSPSPIGWRRSLLVLAFLK